MNTSRLSFNPSVFAQCPEQFRGGMLVNLIYGQ
jgi:hypothetical protein